MIPLTCPGTNYRHDPLGVTIMLPPEPRLMLQSIIDYRALAVPRSTLTHIGSGFRTGTDSDIGPDSVVGAGAFPELVMYAMAILEPA